jgi:uncharacterized protein
MEPPGRRPPDRRRRPARGDHRRATDGSGAPLRPLATLVRLAHTVDVRSQRLVLLADTHVPRRARDLPDQVWRAVDKADVVVHAGDWVEDALLERLQQHARRLIAVYGNNDPQTLRAQLPEVATAEVAGLRLAVVHETGSASGRERRCAARFPEADVVVFGHSHIPWDTTTDTGLRLLNPGSPTDRRRQPFCTYMTAVARAGRLAEVRLESLPLRMPQS